MSKFITSSVIPSIPNRRRPKLLDLYCGAGGCSEGYRRAGFDVYGVDFARQKRYPFPFLQADALWVLRTLLDGSGRSFNGKVLYLSDFAAIHASPPCQAHTALKSMPNAKVHIDMIPETRALLIETGLPYVIENVPGAPLINPALLCGTMFGLRTDCGAELRRHRLFETNWYIGLLPACDHYSVVIGVYGGHGRDRRRTVRVYGGGACTDRLKRPATITVCGDGGGMSKRLESKAGLDARMFCLADRRKAMGIDWMTGNELSQAIPPVYTEFIGRQLRLEIGK